MLRSSVFCRAAARGGVAFFVPLRGLSQVGILEQMAEDMAEDLADAEKTEAEAVSDFDGLVAAKEKEIAAATSAIEDKTERTGKAAVDIVNAKNDLADAQEALADDTNYLAGLKKGCKDQAELYDLVKKTRSEELAAIGATVRRR